MSKTIIEILHAWSEIPKDAPFVAVLPEHSNGYVYVYDKDGRELCTCSGGGAARDATTIAVALNFVASCAVADDTKAAGDQDPGGLAG
jgi:hypothetical protein